MRIRGYEVLEVIGFASLGPVWKVRDKAGKIWAAKLVKYPDPDRYSSISQVDGPHLGTLHDLVPVDNRWVLIMELVEGSPLNSEIELLRPRRIAADILEALAALHRRGVTHGDVSPANILVSEGGRATLIDPDLSNERKGTPSYVPSEPDTPARDIYGWGRICQELGVPSLSADALDPQERPAAESLLQDFSAEPPARALTPEPVAALRSVGLLDAVTIEPDKHAKKPRWSVISMGVVIACAGIGIVLGSFLSGKSESSALSGEPKQVASSAAKQLESVPPTVQGHKSPRTEEKRAADLAPGASVLSKLLKQRAAALEKMDKEALASVSFPNSPSQQADMNLYRQMQQNGITAKGLKIKVTGEHEANGKVVATITQSSHQQCNQTCQRVNSVEYKATFKIRNGKIVSVTRE